MISGVFVGEINEEQTRTHNFEAIMVLGNPWVAICAADTIRPNGQIVVVTPWAGSFLQPFGSRKLGRPLQYSRRRLAFPLLPDRDGWPHAKQNQSPDLQTIEPVSCGNSHVGHFRVFLFEGLLDGSSN